MSNVDEVNHVIQIKVIGIGCGGANAVNHMIAHHVQGGQFICADTDALAISRSAAGRTLQLGASGLGAAQLIKGRDAAELSAEQIREAIDGAQLLFIIAGMGSGTGSGAAPVIARIAKEMGILTVGVVTKPAGGWETGKRMHIADVGLAALEPNVDSLIVLPLDTLFEILGGDDLTQDEFFAHANDMLKNLVGGIAHIINVPGPMNVDFGDVRTVMSEPGKAVMGTAVAVDPDRARIAAERAVACPLLEGIDLSVAKCVLVMVTAAKGSFTLPEFRIAVNTIRGYASQNAHVIYGTAYDDSLGGEMRVTVVATGVASCPASVPRRPCVSPEDFHGLGL